MALYFEKQDNNTKKKKKTFILSDVHINKYQTAEIHAKAPYIVKRVIPVYFTLLGAKTPKFIQGANYGEIKRLFNKRVF